jgi:type I restriction enzyme S subunit
MSEWREYTIGDICSKITSGGTPNTRKNEYYGGEIPWVRTQEVNFNRIYDAEIKITEDGLNNSSAKWIPENSVIIAMYGATAGKVAINKIPVTTNQACCNLIINSDKADYRFIYYNILSRFSNIANMAVGGAQQNLNAGMIKDLPVFLPDLPTQTAIAEILSSLDDKIELNNKINKELENLAQTLFKRWFVDFEFPYENGEPYKSSGGEMVESELGEIPKGWVIYKMSDLLETISKTYPLKNVDNVIFLNTGDIHEGKFLHQNISDSQKLPGQAKKSIQKNDILYSEIRPANKRFAFVYFDSSKYVVSTKLMVLRSKVPFNSLFQYFLLTQNEQIDYLQQLAESRSGTFPQITFSEVSTIKMALPDFQKVNKFVDSVLEPFFTEKFNSELENQKLTNLRDTLLPKLISGELEVQQVLSQMT